jgi:hypothetical protein
MLASMPNKTASTVASEGGKARAALLSPEERTEIARQAAAARWGIPKAQYEGVLTLGDMELPCAVLQDGTRVLSQRAFSGALGAPQGGHAFAKRNASSGVAGLPIFLAYERLKPFISMDLAASLSKPVEYIPLHGGRSAFGIRADLVPAVCEVWLKARAAGALTAHQSRIAAQAELLTRGLAHVGIIALVDEATGYQDDRDRLALAKILEAFVTKELRKWVSTFPADYYKELFRLRDWRFPTLPQDQQKRPVMVGKITNDIVYARLAPGVRQELHRLTPRDEKGRLKQKLFQRLTANFGHPKLREHLASVVVLMRASDTWEQFMRSLDRALPKYKDLPLLDLLEREG